MEELPVKSAENPVEKEKYWLHWIGFSVIMGQHRKKGDNDCDKTDYQFFADYNNIVERVEFWRVWNGSRTEWGLYGSNRIWCIDGHQRRVLGDSETV